MTINRSIADLLRSHATIETTGHPGKNVLINGGMQVSQRGTSVSGVGNGDNGNQSVPEDMWYFDESGTIEGIFTISQEDNGGTNGQDQWMKVLCTTEEALGSTSDMIFVSQKVEGFNATRLLDGSSGIAETTVSADIIIHADGSSGLSFPVKVAFSIHTWDGTGRQCVGDVSIAANDTWERVSVTFPSDSTATFDSNNAAAGHLTVSICGGSGRQATNLTWANDTNDYLTSATDNIADQANNYLGITNVQWEVGSATDFAHEDIGTTLALCKRYFQRLPDGATTVPWSVVCDSPTSGYIFWGLPVDMRATPTMTTVCTGGGVTVTGSDRFSAVGSAYAYNGVAGYQGVTLSGATAGHVGRWTFDAGDTMIWSAEL